MDTLKISKALSNQIRMDILNWLRNPEDHFPPHKEIEGFDQGVCLVFIKDKTGLSQSTISQYMAQLNDAGLVDATRIGKWTYFKRNQKAIEAFSRFISQEL